MPTTSEKERLVSSAAATLAAEIEHVAGELVADELGDEDDISSQIVARLKMAARSISGPADWTADAISIKGRRLTSKGGGSEEKPTGADLVLVVDIKLPFYKATKGVLIQAKKVNSKGEVKSKAERKRLLDQCANLQKGSQSNYVWAYGSTGVKTYSARNVQEAAGSLAKAHNAIDTFAFFFDILRCKAGDRKIDAVTPGTLRKLMHRINVENGVILHARPKGG